MKKKSRMPYLTAIECAWCSSIFVDLKENEHRLVDAIKKHVQKGCKKHPMRKLETKIRKLERKK